MNAALRCYPLTLHIPKVQPSQPLTQHHAKFI